MSIEMNQYTPQFSVFGRGICGISVEMLLFHTGPLPSADLGALQYAKRLGIICETLKVRFSHTKEAILDSSMPYASETKNSFYMHASGFNLKRPLPSPPEGLDVGAGARASRNKLDPNPLLFTGKMLV